MSYQFHIGEKIGKELEAIAHKKRKATGENATWQILARQALLNLITKEKGAQQSTS